ncbi:hypothetical protein ABH917_000019 [Thermobifida halotolerans]
MTNDPPRARKIAAEAIREAAWSKNYPPDLINVALDRLVEASLELPGFTTLDEMAARIRSEVNAEIFAQATCSRRTGNGFSATGRSARPAPTGFGEAARKAVRKVGDAHPGLRTVGHWERISPGARATG